MLPGGDPSARGPFSQYGQTPGSAGFPLGVCILLHKVLLLCHFVHAVAEGMLGLLLWSCFVNARARTGTLGAQGGMPGVRCALLQEQLNSCITCGCVV